jgi:hypothetical protein
MNGTSGNLAQAIRGPLLLIALGILFAVDHAGGPGFWRTWPALIILVGVLKLFERVVSRPAAPGLPPAPGGMAS